MAIGRLRRWSGWDVLGRIGMTLALVVVTAYTSITYVSMAFGYDEPLAGNPDPDWMLGAAWYTSLVLPWTLFARRWVPDVVILLSLVATTTVHTDAAVAVVATVALVRRTRGWRLWVGLALAAAAVGRAFTWDAARPIGYSGVKFLLAPEESAAYEMHVPLAPWTLAVVVLMVGVAAGIGLLIRWRTEAARLSEERDEQELISRRLSGDLARSAERERLAQEIHDSLGHDLSLLSLQASVFEMSAEEDPASAREAAGSIRSRAQEAHRSLRSLVDVMRSPQEGEQPGGAGSPPDLAGLLAEARRGGMDLTVQVCSDHGEMDPPVASALYGVVREALTNARFHAPGRPVRLELRRVGDQMRLTVTNPVATRAAVHTEGLGLAGMRRRVAAVGGTLEADAREGTFVLRACLPDRTAPAPTSTRSSAAGVGSPGGPSRPGVGGLSRPGLEARVEPPQSEVETRSEPPQPGTNLSPAPSPSGAEPTADPSPPEAGAPAGPAQPGDET